MQPCFFPSDRLSALMDPKEILGWVLLGLFSGLIARRVMPGEEKGGCLITIILGILGAVVGGWIGRHVGFLPVADPGPGLPSPGRAWELTFQRALSAAFSVALGAVKRVASGTTLRL